MVKLEGKTGGAIYINPETVLLVGVSDDGTGTVVHVGVGIWCTVKGTPDEVHAKLFPEAVDAGFMIDVLAWVADSADEKEADIPADIARRARKALGRTVDLKEAPLHTDVDWRAVADELASRHFSATEYSDGYGPVIAKHTRKALNREEK